MKRIISIIFFSILFIFIIHNPVHADETATFEVTVDAPKAVNGVATTKEVTFYYGVKNFVNLDQYGFNGINVFRASLNYDEDIFEPIEINLDDNGNYDGIKTRTYNGGIPIEGQNGWDNVIYNPVTKKIVVSNESYINSESLVLKIVLKVKVTAPDGKHIVTLSDIEAANPEADIYPVSKTVSTNVAIVTPGPISYIWGEIDPDDENGFGGYLRVMPEITVKQMKQLYSVFTTINDVTGKPLNDSDFVPTGATASYSNNLYTFIAVGDLNSDGKLTAIDLSREESLLSRDVRFEITDNERRAADIKWDSKLKSSDLAKTYQMIVGLGDPYIGKWEGNGEIHCYPLTY